MSTDIEQLVEALKKEAGDYRIIMEGPPTSDQLSWDRREVRAYEAAVALEREHRRAESYREAVVQARRDDEIRTEALAERDAAAQRAEIAEELGRNQEHNLRTLTAAIREALRIDTHHMHPEARRILSAALDTETGGAS